MNSNENENEYISSDEEEINETSLKNFIMCVQQNPTDGDMIFELVELLTYHNYLLLAKSLNTLALKSCSNNEDIFNYSKKYGISENYIINNLLENVWLNFPKYYCNESITMFENNSDIKNQKHNPFLDLNLLQEKFNVIPSLPATSSNIDENREFNIFRNFKLEKFSTYMLSLFCVYTSNIEVNVSITTDDNLSRLNYKLPKTQIQYKFNSLNLDSINIGIVGSCKNNRNGNQNNKNVNGNNSGQIRIMHMFLSKINNNFELDNCSNKLIRSLSPKIPVIANMVISDKKQFNGFVNSINSLINYVDRINIYINENAGKQHFDIFKNNKIKLKYGNKKKFYGLFEFTNEIVGYQFFVSPNLIYDDDYVPILLTKLQQYNNLVVVGLKGIQVNNSKPYISYDKSCSVIPPFIGINQDVKCNFLGVDSLAFFNGIIYPDEEMSDVQLEINLGLIGLKKDISFVCIERLNLLVKVNNDIGYEKFIIDEQSENILKKNFTYKE